MSVEWIWLDMDGVLVDFHRPFLEAYGMDECEIDYFLNNYPKNDYDLCKILNIDQDDMNRIVDKQGLDFWLSMNWYSWANDVIEFAFSFGAKVGILTDPGAFSFSRRGKEQKLRELKRYEDFTEIRITGDKAALANKHSILVDDAPHKVRSFQKAGGEAVTFPAPWNYATHSNSIENIEQLRLYRGTLGTRVYQMRNGTKV